MGVVRILCGRPDLQCHIGMSALRISDCEAYDASAITVVKSCKRDAVRLLTTLNVRMPWNISSASNLLKIFLFSIECAHALLNSIDTRRHASSPAPSIKGSHRDPRTCY